MVVGCMVTGSVYVYHTYETHGLNCVFKSSDIWHENSHPPKSHTLTYRLPTCTLQTTSSIDATTYTTLGSVNVYQQSTYMPISRNS